MIVPWANAKTPYIRYPSRVGHVKPGLNPRGQSRKAKYSMTTDSEPSRATERWEEPRSGEDTEPETPCLRAVCQATLKLTPLATLKLTPS